MVICDKYRWPFGETGHQRGGEGEGRSRIPGEGMVGGGGEDRGGRANSGREPSMPTNKKNPESERGESERREEQVPEEAQTQSPGGRPNGQGG